MSEEADRARRLLESCQMPGYDPEGAETYPAVEDGGVNSIGNALAAAQVLATLAVADELRRSNEDRAEFYREVLDVLSEAKGPTEAARCAAMRGENPHDRCTYPAGHTEFVRTVLHVDEAGIAFSNPVGYVGDGSPVGSGQPAAAQQCGRRADLATADDGSSVWFTCVLDRGHADFHTDGHGVEWITTPAATSQREGEDR